jgi:hypothetical protein
LFIPHAPRKFKEPEEEPHRMNRFDENSNLVKLIEQRETKKRKKQTKLKIKKLAPEQEHLLGF